MTDEAPVIEEVAVVKKRGGRPFGGKNKPKVTPPPLRERFLEASLVCGICQVIVAEQAQDKEKGVSPLLDKIWGCSAFKRNGQPMARICKEYNFSTPSMSNHVRKHQFVGKRLPGNITPLRLLQARSKVKDVLAAKDPILAARANFETLWDEIIDVGIQAIRRGEIQVNQQSLLKAAADKANYQAKRQDQGLQMAKMVYDFASGAVTDASEDDPELKPEEDPHAYQALADELASRPD